MDIHSAFQLHYKIDELYITIFLIDLQKDIDLLYLRQAGYWVLSEEYL